MLIYAFIFIFKRCRFFSSVVMLFYTFFVISFKRSSCRSRLFYALRAIRWLTMPRHFDYVATLLPPYELPDVFPAPHCRYADYFSAFMRGAAASPLGARFLSASFFFDYGAATAAA